MNFRGIRRFVDIRVVETGDRCTEEDIEKKGQLKS